MGIYNVLATPHPPTSPTLSSVWLPTKMDFRTSRCIQNMGRGGLGLRNGGGGGGELKENEAKLLYMVQIWEGWRKNKEATTEGLQVWGQSSGVVMSD